MRDIQFMPDKNDTLREKYVRSCIEPCDDECDGEVLVSMSVPSNAILMSLDTIGYALSEDLSIDVSIGTEEVGDQLTSETVTAVNGTYTQLPLDNLVVPEGGLPVTFTMATFPTEGKACVLIKYLDASTIGKVNALIPDLCDNCPDCK